MWPIFYDKFGLTGLTEPGSSTFGIFGLLLHETLVQLPWVIVQRLDRLMYNFVLGFNSCVQTLDHAIELILRNSSSHVPVKMKTVKTQQNTGMTHTQRRFHSFFLFRPFLITSLPCGQGKLQCFVNDDIITPSPSCDQKNKRLLFVFGA